MCVCMYVGVYMHISCSGMSTSGAYLIPYNTICVVCIMSVQVWSDACICVYTCVYVCMCMCVHAHIM